MSNKIQVIQDKAGNNVFPITHEKAVRDSSGVSLEAKFSALESKTYVKAWDGASTPVVANIPAGVVVSYDGTNYTGTLSASSSTDGKLYLIKNGTEYDRYASTINLGGTYIWSYLGTTAMSLSGYVTEEELNQLDQRLYGEVIHTPTEIGWKDMVSANAIRTMMFALDKSQTGDVITAKLSNYTNFKIGLALVPTETYATSGLIYDSGWAQQDLSYTVPEGNGGYYIRLAVGKVGDGGITVEEAEAVVSEASVVRIITTIEGGDIPEIEESINTLQTQVRPLDEQIEDIDAELYGGEVHRVEEIGWYRFQRYSTTRVYKFALDKSSVGDVITAKLPNYSTYRIGISLCATTAWSTTTGYDSGWKTADISYTVPEGKEGYYIRVAIARLTEGSPITIEDAKASGLEAKVVRDHDVETAGLCVRVDDLENSNKPPVGSIEVSYSGDKVVIDTQKNECYFDLVATLSGDGYVQGGTVFGDFYFQVAHEMRYVVIYDLKNEVEIQKIDLETGEVGHANDVSFGVEYYDDGDPFPLFYVSSESNKKLFVYRITGTRGNYSMSIVQVITFDTDFYFPNAVIDAYAGRCVLFGYKENSWQSGDNGNAYLITTFKLPKLAEGDVTVTEFGDTITLPFIYAQQGAGARSGILYLASGVSDPIIYVINYLNGEVLSSIDTSIAEDAEPEGLGIWEDKLVVTYINRKLYVIYFNQ